MKIINQARVPRRLLNDVKSVIGSMYSMNAPYAIGYVFNPMEDMQSIARGMFFDRGDNKLDWEYYLDYETGILSKTAGS